jgi:Tfp pilus assembly protein PilV
MSLRHTSGTSLVEVMVMMVILGISIVGIYGMVDSGKRLASLTDTRLNAVNIAREGLESVTTLRDSFALSGYES